MGLPPWTPLLGLCCALSLVSAQRHTVFWNSTNPKFQKEDYTVEVRLNEYLDIICPHYEDKNVPVHLMERYTLYLVEREEYDTCKPRSKEQVRWQCNRPDALHGPERLSEKFQRFTPFTLGKEFREGHEYYYISKPIHRHGDSCLKLRVKVIGKKTLIPPGHIPTQKGTLQSDDPDAPMLRSVGYNSAPRLGSPLPFIGLLLWVFLSRGP
ncbi:ephrin-A1 [Pantherophis guttatus]|uniref:Ephrin-A1 n=1 Tax=Pantherophis guttatus TaxID=94885 RepID=A0A6P9B2Z0_PANGU|nr:ephrin-A1 [Pantherophis guttatus]